MARVAIYMRVSSPGQEENYSLPGQEEDCRKWCAGENHTVVKIYNDGAQHSWTLNRPGLNQALLDAKMDVFDILLVGKYDRLSRDQVQQNVVVYQLGMYKKTVVSAHEPLPSDPVMAELIRNLHAFRAQGELNDIRLRTTGGRKRRVRDGKLLVGAHQLYGYIWANADQKHGKDAYLIDPETAPTVRLIFDLLVANGKGLRAIAAELERRGILTPGQMLLERGQLPKGRTVSSTWRLSTLRRILSNPAYIGKHSGWRHSTEEVMRKDKTTGELYPVNFTRLRDESDPDRVAYDEAVCPPIISEDMFVAAQTILRRNQEESSRRMREPKAVLLRNGFAVCGYCGRKIQTKFHKGNGHYRYMCASERDTKSVQCEGGRWSMKADDLDRIVWNFIIHAFENPEVIRAAFERYKASQATNWEVEHERLESVRGSLEATGGRWRNAVNGSIDARDDMTRAEFTHRAEELANQIKQLETERDNLERTLGGSDMRVGQIESLIEMGTIALDHLRTATYEDKRMFLFALGVVVRIWSSTQYKIEWRLEELGEEWVQLKLNVPNEW